MKHRTAKHPSAVHRFRIEAYSPETLPMARLAEYMTSLADLAGEKAFVHFDRLEAGGTVLVQRIDHEAEPKVLDRLKSLGRDDATPDVRSAYRTLNRLLREDNGTGRLTRGAHRETTILRFPGVQEPDERIPGIRQHGSVDGVVIRIGGKDDTVPVWLEVEGRVITHCYSDRPTAKRLAQSMYEPVRLFGKGRWTRDGDGEWSLAEFRIESFEVLESVNLIEALQRVRAVAGSFPEKAYEGLRIVRHGPTTPKRRHGRD